MFKISRVIHVIANGTCGPLEPGEFKKKILLQRNEHLISCATMCGSTVACKLVPVTSHFVVFFLFDITGGRHYHL